MKKNQTELISYAIMPRHEMEAVLTVNDSRLFGKSLELLFCRQGHNCLKTSGTESPFGIIEYLIPQSVFPPVEVGKDKCCQYFRCDRELAINR
ncbi:MAG: hypothetical protein HF314_16715 [Ignavibacteria bacterium]|jgi:hypothetical protein|nr:hypothetical protein [Ignavibacteria bacterium]MCU7504727.1 hypothetical protein [Ignavibacteria bacterium]MCU7516329.1 hypothetical protein [Ignavibacteria bacterium]